MSIGRLKKQIASVSPKNFEIILIIAISLTFVIGLVAANSIRSYTSDDVGVQVIVHDWGGGENRDAVVGTDNYLTRIPLYILQNHLITVSPRTEIFISVLLINLVLLLGFIYLAHSMLTEKIKSSKLSLSLFYLPICWFFSLSVLPILSISQVSRVTTYMCPNFRSAELGIAFILIILTSYYIDRVDKKPSLKKMLLFVSGLILLAVYFYDDPFFIYMLALPLTLATVLMYLRKKVSLTKLTMFIFYLLIAVVGSLIIGLIMRRFGYDSVGNVPKQFIGAGQIWHNFQNTAFGEFKSFSAILSHRTVGQLIPSLLNVLLASSCMVAVVITIVKARKSTLKTKSLILVLVVLIDVAIYTLTTTNGVNNDRYLIFAVLSEVLLLSSSTEYIRRKCTRYIFLSVSIIGIMLNLAVNIHVIWKQSSNGAVKPNSINYTIIRAIEREGVYKGYASYWYGNIDTYLSQFKVQSLPVVCSNGKLDKFNWIINKPAFSQTAKKTFYLYDISSDWPTVNDCTSNALTSSMGITPMKTVNIGNDYRLYIYNQDIGQRMGQFSIQ